MHKKHMFLRVFSKITIFACVFCIFFISTVFATLPAGYTELEYIESTGTQYIDTGLKQGNNDEFGFVYQQTMLDSNYRSLFGAGVSGQNGEFYISQTQSDDYLANVRFSIPRKMNKHILVWITKNVGPQELIIDSTTYTVSAKVTPNASLNIMLFARNANQSKMIGKVYSYYQKRDALYLINLIPAKRNSDGEVGMYDTVTNTFFTNQGTGDFIAGPIAHCKTVSTDGVTCVTCKSGYKLDSNGGCVGVIEIATTKMVDEEFAAAEAKLATTVQTIESVVSRTITQTEQIATLQEEKQTRPDETCPAGKKCLLVMDENDTPHWYEIIEAVYDFVANWFTPFNNAGKPTHHYTTDTSSGSTIWTSYNGFYKGDSAFRSTYTDGYTDTHDRPFAHATRCNADYTRTTDSREAGICYPETGVFKTLTDGEWAIVYNGDEGTSTKKVPASVVYGTSKCTTVAGPNDFTTSNPTKFSELTPAQQTAWGVEPNSTNKSANAGYLNCWCKMTALGIPNSGETIASGQSTAGTIYSLPESSSAWVFLDAHSFGSAASCASNCANYCAYCVRNYAGFRATVLSWQ